MIHEGDKLDREIKRLQSILLTAITDKHRRQVERAIAELKRRKSDWERPH